MNHQEKLKSILEELNFISGDQSATVSIMYDTGPDESCLYGTRDGYINMAKAIIKVLAEEPDVTKSTEFCGVKTKSSTELKKTCDISGDVVLDNMDIVEQQSDQHKIVQYYQYRAGLANKPPEL